MPKETRTFRQVGIHELFTTGPASNLFIKLDNQPPEKYPTFDGGHAVRIEDGQVVWTPNNRIVNEPKQKDFEQAGQRYRFNQYRWIMETRCCICSHLFLLGEEFRRIQFVKKNVTLGVQFDDATQTFDYCIQCYLIHIEKQDWPMWFYIAIVFLISCGIMDTLCEMCPYGYEDETGFHYGVDKRDKVWYTHPVLTILLWNQLQLTRFSLLFTLSILTVTQISYGLVMFKSPRWTNSSLRDMSLPIRKLPTILPRSSNGSISHESSRTAFLSFTSVRNQARPEFQPALTQFLRGGRLNFCVGGGYSPYGVWVQNERPAETGL